MDRNVNFRPDEDLTDRGEVEFEPADTFGSDTSTRFESAGTQDRTEELKSRASGKAEELKSQASEKAEELKSQADSSRSRAADQLNRVSDKLDQRARDMETRGGVQARAGTVARQASERLDRSADYVRTHEVDEMRDDLERQIRSHPIASVGIALGAGFVLGRMIS